jgi:alpha-L-rhamnosidase
MLLAAAPAFSQSGRPEKLRCESLASPLGVDAKQPVFSWQLRDTRHGAKQSAYQLKVASSEKLLSSGKQDIWDSGKIQSDHSIGVAFAGKSLKASTRYYWRVKVWDGEGKPYPVSETAWWETGLMEQQNWKAKWIGYDEPELDAIRKANAEWITNAETDSSATTGDTHHQFRFHFDASKELRRALLYATGRDSAAAWVNGQQVFQSQPLPRWKQMPWKTYSVTDITKNVARGANLLGVEVVRYREERRRGRPDDFQAPMSATIYLKFADESTQIFKSSAQGWRAALDAKGDWRDAKFDDSSWEEAIRYTPPAESFDGPLGDPWPTGAVKLLR